MHCHHLMVAAVTAPAEGSREGSSRPPLWCIKALFAGMLATWDEDESDLRDIWPGQAATTPPTIRSNPVPNFLLAYRGEMPTTPSEGAKMKNEWNAWFETLNDAVVDRGAPIETANIVNSTGITEVDGASRLTGYTIVNASTIEAACEMAKSCPIVLNDSGSVEVAQIHTI